LRRKSKKIGLKSAIVVQFRPLTALPFRASPAVTKALGLRELSCQFSHD
jgi:hypothetical protein